MFIHSYAKLLACTYRLAQFVWVKKLKTFKYLTERFKEGFYRYFISLDAVATSSTARCYYTRKKGESLIFTCSLKLACKYRKEFRGGDHCNKIGRFKCSAFKRTYSCISIYKDKYTVYAYLF